MSCGMLVHVRAGAERCVRVRRGTMQNHASPNVALLPIVNMSRGEKWSLSGWSLVLDGVSRELKDSGVVASKMKTLAQVPARMRRTPLGPWSRYIVYSVGIARAAGKSEGRIFALESELGKNALAPCPYLYFYKYVRTVRSTTTFTELEQQTVQPRS